MLNANFRAHDSLIYIICVCLHSVVSNTCCVVFLFCFTSSVLPVSLDCPILIAPVVFSNVYLAVFQLGRG